MNVSDFSEVLAQALQSQTTAIAGLIVNAKC